MSLRAIKQTTHSARPRPAALLFLLVAIVLFGEIYPALGAPLKTLPEHVPKILASVTPIGRLAATNELRLAVASNLRTTNWINFGSAVIASGSVASLSDSLTNSQRFYRVVLEP